VRDFMCRTIAVGALATGLCVDGLAPASVVAPRPRVGVVDARNGAIRSVPLGPNAAVVSFDPTPMHDAPEGRLFVAVQGAFDGMNGSPRGLGQVRILDARDGRLLHSSFVGYVPDSIALDTKMGRLFVANKVDHTVSILDSATGALQRTVVVPPSPLQIAVDATAQRAIVVTGGVADNAGISLGSGGVSVLDTRSGHVLNTLPLAETPMDLAIDQQRGRAYVLAEGLNVVALKSGGIIDRLPLQGRGMSVAQDDKTDRVFVLTSRQPNPALQATTILSTRESDSGRLLARVTLPGGAGGIVVDAAARRVLVFTDDYVDGGERVGLIDAGSGRVLHLAAPANMLHVSALVAPVVDTRRGYAFAAVDNSSSAIVGVWTTRTGALVRTIAAIGSNVTAMAVDERGGRLYVVSMNRNTPDSRCYLTIVSLKHLMHQG